MKHQEYVQDGLPEYGDIRKALKKAVDDTLDKDYDLIALGGHEQAIAHRIAVYLECYFPGFHTDCEYNRDKHKAKDLGPESPGKNKRMRPDIIVHRRDSPSNVLAIEMKANANSKNEGDLIKLKSLKAEKTYLYKGVAFVEIKNATSELESGVLEAIIEWYDVKSNQIILQPNETQSPRCSKHIEEVIEIVDRRKKHVEAQKILAATRRRAIKKLKDVK